MSALGQKKTCAVQEVMSALPPIATANAKLAKGHVCFTPESGHVRQTTSAARNLVYSVIFAHGCPETDPYCREATGTAQRRPQSLFASPMEAGI